MRTPGLGIREPTGHKLALFRCFVILFKSSLILKILRNQTGPAAYLRSELGLGIYASISVRTYDETAVVQE